MQVGSWAAAVGAFESCTLAMDCELSTSCSNLYDKTCDADNAEVLAEATLTLDISNATPCPTLEGQATVEARALGVLDFEDSWSIELMCDPSPMFEAGTSSDLGDVCGTIHLDESGCRHVPGRRGYPLSRGIV